MEFLADHDVGNVLFDRLCAPGTRIPLSKGIPGLDVPGTLDLDCSPACRLDPARDILASFRELR